VGQVSFPESDIQFLARQMIALREGDQLRSEDARRLQELAEFGHSDSGHQTTTTLPEERRDGSVLPTEAGTRDVVR
jgi:hypothetical protein